MVGRGVAGLILSKQNIASVNIDQLVNDKLRDGKIEQILFVVPTRRKIRYLTRELISFSPSKSVSGLKIETIGSFAEKMLTETEGSVRLISEEASILLLSHSFNKIKLRYFSQYKDQIPFGTLERIKNVISEYKRHGITPERLREEAEKLTGGEQLKTFDIADVFADYQKTLDNRNFKEIGDIYSGINLQQKEKFEETYTFLYPDARYTLVNGFDEFTSPEVELINYLAGCNGTELFIILDYYKYNPSIFSHLNACHDRFITKGFKEIKDDSQVTQSRFLNVVRENLSLKKPASKSDLFSGSINQITAQSREEEIELIAKEIKKLLVDEKVKPEKICIVFSLIGNYSPIIRDRFNVYGIPFNLTDRFSLSTSPPVKAIINLLEMLENDFYYKNIFRAFSSGFLDKVEVDISKILKTSVELKIISGYENWLSRIRAAVSDISFSEEENNYEEKIKNYESAGSDLKKINSLLKPFAERLTPEEFRKNILSLIYELNFPSKLLNASHEIIENDAAAFNAFLKIIDETTELLNLEFENGKKFPLHYYLKQLRTITSFTRYNIPEKPGYGVQITTLNEIRGLNFDYLFIGGLNDGDFPTRFTPEVFFSGSFAKEEVRHQVEQRYLFYQALCTWKKKLYLTYPEFNVKRELVKSSFLQDFSTLFEMQQISKDNFNEEIFSREELIELLGKISEEERMKLKFPDEFNINTSELNKAIEIDKKRMEEPYGESEYTGFISENISEEAKKKLMKISEGEFSATQLENYAKCPYKYFVENILRLETIDEPVEELEAFEYGSLIHTILYEFYTKLNEKGIILFNCSDDEFKTAENLLFKIAEKKFDDLKLSSELSFFEREKLLGINGRRSQSILHKFLEEERMNDSGYVPFFFEMSFGKVRHSEKYSKQFKERVDTGRIKLRGKIDRVDLNKEQQTLTVIDYKLGGAKPSAEDLLSGISLQLPLYLFAAKELIRRELDKDFNPAGAEIFSLKFDEKDFGRKSISIKPRRKKSENIDEEISQADEMIKICLETVNKFADDISQGKFHLTTLKNREAKVCRFCDFKKMCRIQEVD